MTITYEAKCKVGSCISLFVFVNFTNEDISNQFYLVFYKNECRMDVEIRNLCNGNEMSSAYSQKGSLAFGYNQGNQWMSGRTVEVSCANHRRVTEFWLTECFSRNVA